MRELNNSELATVNGASIVGDIWDDIKRIAREVDDVYADLVGSAANMMCTFTHNCE